MAKVALELIKKYNKQGPRYTSYPATVQFQKADKQDILQLHNYLVERNSEPNPISLYFHIPFCFSLCWYCGCTKIITKDTDRGDAYLEYLEKEMDQIKGLIHPDSEVVQIHFGGGTPTFLKPEQLMRLGKSISSRFNQTSATEFSVEIDPRRCTREHVLALGEIGCNRASLGVQDTNRKVQEAIHRIQPLELTQQVTGWLRANDISSINYDLIYGLPKQSLQTFQRTMDDVLTLAPDRLAVYSYAHVPSIMPSQKLLNEKDFPSTNEKMKMLQSSIAHLTRNGYCFIGMDHFSRQDEELAIAEREGTLQRNFQGYSTLAGADLFAFGMSGISNTGSWYWQNSKEIADYYNRLEEGKSPISKLLKLNTDDLLRKDVIMSVMCRMKIDFAEISEKWKINFSHYFRDELIRMDGFEQDDLIIRTPNGITITENGRLFLRNIAMNFDYYLNKSQNNHSFSKTV